MKIVTLTLSPAFDRHIYLAGFTKGRETYADKSNASLGGKGINVSRIITSEKENTLAIVLSGIEDKSKVEKGLNDIPHVIVDKDGSVRENITIHEKNDETRISLRDFASDTDIENVEKILLENIEKDDFFVFAGSLPNGIEKEKIISLFEKVRKGVSFFALDSKSFDFDEIMRIKPDIIKPNEFEAEALFGTSDINRIRAAGQRTLMTKGGDGAYLIERDRILFCPAPKIDVLSTVGAGDATLAGYLIARLHDSCGKTALVSAVAHGSATCMTEGTEPPKEEDIVNFVNTLQTITL